MTKKRYRDIDISFEPHPITGDILKKFDENDIKQSMINLIHTDFYSRLDTNIGVDIRSALFSLDSVVSKNYIENIIIDVMRYEPRATIHDVVVNIHEQNKYKIQIIFTIENSIEPSTLSTYLELID